MKIVEYPSPNQPRMSPFQVCQVQKHLNWTLFERRLDLEAARVKNKQINELEAYTSVIALATTLSNIYSNDPQFFVHE